MRIPIGKQQELADELQQQYDEFQANLNAHRTQLMNEVEKKLDEERIEFSQKMHEAYAKGVSKAMIRSATRKAGNPTAFNKLWSAFTPDQEIDLRTVSKNSVASEVVRWWRWVDDMLYVTIDGDHEVAATGVRYEIDPDSGSEFVVFDSPDSFGDEYPQVAKAATEALDERGEE